MTSTAFVLILFAHVGALGEGNSNALSIAEFTSEERCQAAGKAAHNMAVKTVKEIRWVCVPK